MHEFVSPGLTRIPCARDPEIRRSLYAVCNQIWVAVSCRTAGFGSNRLRLSLCLAWLVVNACLNVGSVLCFVVVV